MKVDRTGVSFAEQIVFDLRRPKLGIYVRLVLAEETTVFGFDSYDAIHRNQLTHRIRISLNQKTPLTQSPFIELGKDAESKAHKRPQLPRAWRFAFCHFLRARICNPTEFTLAHGTRLPRHPKIKETTKQHKEYKKQKFRDAR
jgi:hypothetical protein